MGNHTSCIMVGNNRETIQLIRSDGSIRILPQSVKASQITKEFPQNLVCHSDSFYIGQKTPVLSPDDKLKAGNIYFLLPNHFFQSPLLLVLLASLISLPTKVALSPAARTTPALRSIGRASALCQSFEIQKSDVGEGLRIRVCPDFITKLMEDGRVNVDEHKVPVPRDFADDEPYRLCNTPELQKHYKQLVTYRGQCWKPKLENIREKEDKIHHRIFMKIKRSIPINSS